ncbi:DUF1919 domain-containing protein [Butyrivibrio sp. FCS006]|uniref:DUF1919 domain-containing protein n=1 Tax=Butyrivibrio sp. FCS006 TaxID=1280684 RepID=UPI0003FC21D8|nr:DUF1919 domain-containing protein [Butyrivibrio sp. FCS006]
MKICDNSKCTACGACRDVCPKECISFIKNEYGSEIINVDESKCINCGRCKDVCQIVNPISMAEPQKTYAVCLKNNEIRGASASGGAAYAFYSKVLEDGGLAYGASFDDYFRVVFTKTSSIDDLKKFQGSKYTFSDMEGCYKDVLQELKNNKRIIFIGTSCQCAAMKKFIPAVMQEQLMLVDIICHGMPPATYWEEYTENVAAKHGKISSVSFRDNNIFRLKIETEDGTVIEEKAKNNLFMANYTRKVFYRENCYACKYASPERVSDVTIGDYWGRDRQNMLKPREYGMSVVLGNTDKGIKLVESCGDRLVITLKDYKSIIDSNEQLRGASQKPSYRQTFLNQYCKVGFMQAASTVVEQIHKSKSVSMPRKVYRYLKRTLNKKPKLRLEDNRTGLYIREHFRNSIDRSRLKNKDFTLLTNDCMGGVILRDLGQEFRSPMIDLFIRPNDFVKFLEDFDIYIKLDIREVYYDLDYPVGMLGDIPIFFKNYLSFDEAITKWKERIATINYENIVVVMSEQEGCTHDTLERFEKLPYEKKVCFTEKNYPEFPHCVQIRKNLDKVRDYSAINFLGKRIYQYGKKFDYIEFLNNGTIDKSNRRGVNE